jgi:ATP-dependent helicase/nuclease subunit A
MKKIQIFWLLQLLEVGKTAVLVERIIQKIIKDGVDIDKLLVVTFTNAAASEMRERVLEAIYKKLDEEPENENLARQINLLGKSNICTIHSFCLDVIKNNFFEIDISPNFRIGSEEEIVLMKQDVLEEVFEKKYEEKDENFLELVDIYADYKGDEKLKDIVLKLYEFSQSAPFPNEWLEEKVNMFNQNDVSFEADFSKTQWGKILLSDLEETLIDGINNLKMLQNKMAKYPELDKFLTVILQDIDVLNSFEKAVKTSWDLAFEYGNNFSFDRWPTDKKVTMPLKDEAKEIRSNVKDKIKDKVNDILLSDSKSAIKDIFEMYKILNSLKELVLEFDNSFKAQKKDKNIIDFNDIEHYALKILVKKDENGNYIPTETAKRYSEKFEEIAIDEYQDSNQVQEHILTSVSKGNNIFMVGDVKQSIYKFRRACPDLFLEKYQNYSLNGNDKGLKIQLFKNFRSRKNILDVTNKIFESIMSSSLGEIEYTEEEYLNLGADYEEVKNGVTKSELCVIDNSTDFSENEELDELVEEIEMTKKEELEGKYIAKRIREMIDNKLIIKDKKLGMRPIKYKDIVILLRSTKSANIFEKELLKNNIPVFTDGTSEYLDTIEIQTIMNLLKIFDNPLDDIVVVSVLRSVIFGFTDNEIIEIRLVNRESSFWNTILEALEKLENEPLRKKLENFVNKIKEWKAKSEYMPISNFIWEIYVETGYYNYVSLMTNGSLRRANLKMLFERAKEYEKTSFKGLFYFIRFIEKLKLGNSDLSAAKIIGENEDVVRIMSIHKSKGLEFPVVFLSNCSKKLNLEDLKGEILLHKDLGIGPEYINPKMKISYSTLAKEAMKVKLREENISEEMRILYVALTRAKEKLIITAVKKNEAKELSKKKDLVQIYSSSKKVSPILLKKYTSYLDWIELACLNIEAFGENIDFLETKIINSANILEKEEKLEEESKKFDFSKYSDLEKIEEKLNWKYQNLSATKIPIKSTVSTIKELDNDGVDFFELGNKNIGLSEIVPEFLSTEKITSSKIGTLTHLVLQKIDFNKVKSEEDVKNFIEYLVLNNFINDIEAKKINSKRIFEFINSEFAGRIKNAKKVYKEKPFCIEIDASKILKEASEEKILVQGIIDLYYENDNGNLILVDYKTDYVENKNEKELIEKYKVQLKLYQQALEEATNQKVEEVYIYSLFLNKEIKIS